ncbi:hypothetical protein N8T08_002848 [Aspergillus melleus]|uniref:Uncharacterized protein n=1 Tax=Aspergillus melleus TaxID=138277 RepID=A0ACC3ALF7_9EURO|nr:hypothetical protein N8T08_002848 [Aspergillus melleus]
MNTSTYQPNGSTIQAPRIKSYSKPNESGRANLPPESNSRFFNAEQQIPPPLNVQLDRPRESNGHSLDRHLAETQNPAEHKEIQKPNRAILDRRPERTWSKPPVKIPDQARNLCRDSIVWNKCLWWASGDQSLPSYFAMQS